MNFRRILLLIIALFIVTALIHGCVVVRSGPAYPRTVTVTPSTYYWYYYPDSGVYYNISQHYYYYPSGSVWYKSYTLPTAFALYYGNRVRLQITGLPYIKHSEHYRRYPPRHREHREEYRQHEPRGYYDKRREHYDEREHRDIKDNRRDYRENQNQPPQERDRKDNRYPNSSRENRGHNESKPVFQSPYVPKSGQTRPSAREHENFTRQRDNTAGSQNRSSNPKVRTRRPPSQPAPKQDSTRHGKPSTGKSKSKEKNHKKSDTHKKHSKKQKKKDSTKTSDVRSDSNETNSQENSDSDRAKQGGRFQGR